MENQNSIIHNMNEESSTGVPIAASCCTSCSSCTASHSVEDIVEE